MKLWRILRLLTCLVVVLVGVAVLSFGTPYNYSAAARSGKVSVPYVQQFDRLFPKADHYISYFSGAYGPPTWNSEAVLHGRYVLTMQVPVSFNRLRNRIRSYGQPTFSLNEVESVAPSAGGGHAVTYSGGVQFGLQQWKKLVESGGDLRVLGITPKKDQPVAGVEQLSPGNR